MAETQGAVMVYEARDGQTITLNFDTIRRYLVQGHPEFVVPSEFMYFMGVAKSGGMNPFKRDCWLIKYNQKDNAAIITAIGFLRSRAKAQRDCKGWKTGIIVMRDKQVVYSDGLKLAGDELIGGWARGKPEGWDEDTIIEVNLDGYIKKTREGQVTAFWKPEKQPTQIAKVAESQLLRTLWPDEFQNIYTDAEISPDDGTRGLPEISEETGEEVDAEFDADAHEEFDTKVAQLKAINVERLNVYVKFAAEHSEITIYELKQAATERFDEFLSSFQTWEKKHPVEGKPEKGKKDPISEQYINLQKAGFSTWVHKNLERIPDLHTIYQDEIKAKWQKLYPDDTFALDNKENAATGEITPPEGNSEDKTEDEEVEEKPSAFPKDEYPIKCTNDEIAADRVTLNYCENMCRFKEKSDGSLCEDYLNYVQSLAGKQ